MIKSDKFKGSKICMIRSTPLSFLYSSKYKLFKTGFLHIYGIHYGYIRDFFLIFRYLNIFFLFFKSIIITGAQIHSYVAA